MALITNLLLFLFTGGTLCLLIWTSFELFRSQEDPLSDRLEGLQSQAMVVAARATRRKASARGLDRFLYLIALVPGGEDWLNGTEKLLAQAGIRRKSALALYCIFVLLFVSALAAGTIGGLLRRRRNAVRYGSGVVFIALGATAALAKRTST